MKFWQLYMLMPWAFEQARRTFESKACAAGAGLSPHVRINDLVLDVVWRIR